MDSAFSISSKLICEPGEDVSIALDPAASEFYQNGTYVFDREDRTSGEMIDYYDYLVRSYPIISIEDGLAENDWEGWRQLTERLGGKIELVGDDIFVTYAAIFRKGIKEGITNAILIKPNQIGPLRKGLQIQPADVD
ncbi:MAG: hypothetical protein M0Z32_08225 [Actinomycetota bacterium]|nr:hypothetical protein [Actinomycetota bacterium]MDA8167712.1 hypothetical protein [Actinomycetota bacterium]